MLFCKCENAFVSPSQLNQNSIVSIIIAHVGFFFINYLIQVDKSTTDAWLCVGNNHARFGRGGTPDTTTSLE